MKKNMKIFPALCKARQRVIGFFSDTQIPKNLPTYQCAAMSNKPCV